MARCSLGLVLKARGQIGNTLEELHVSRVKHKNTEANVMGVGWGRSVICLFEVEEGHHCLRRQARVGREVGRWSARDWGSSCMKIVMLSPIKWPV